MQLDWKARYTDETATIRVNLCKNPDFNVNPLSYWVTSGATGTRAQFVGNAKFGPISLARTVTSTAAALVVWDPGTATLPATAGTQYTCSAYVFSSTSRTARVNLEWRNGVGTVISTSNGATVTTSSTPGTYVRPTVTATAPANTATVRIQLEITNAVNGDTHYWSNVLLEAAASAGNYFDGNRFDPETPPKYVTKVVWDGGQGQSTSSEYIYTWYNVSNIQALSFTKGRRRQIDDYPIDVGALTVGPIPAWSPPPLVGNRILFYFDYPGLISGQTEFQFFWGRISDVQFNYGPVTNEDTVEIAVDGIQAELGRAQLNALAISQGLTDDQVFEISTAAGITVAGFDGRSTGAALTWTGNAYDALSLITRTEEARFFADLSNGSAELNNPILWWYGRDSIRATTTSLHFGDGTTAAPPIGTALKYEAIVFRSAAEEYYNSVTIQPESGSVAIQTASTGETPQFGLTRQTNDVSNTQALNHAQYLLNQYSTRASTIREVTFTDQQQPGGNSFVLQALECINTKIVVGFRSVVYNAIGEGVVVNATPGQTRVTVVMSPADNNAYLILDDPIYGKLDSNRLGF